MKNDNSHPMERDPKSEQNHNMTEGDAHSEHMQHNPEPAHDHKAHADVQQKEMKAQENHDHAGHQMAAVQTKGEDHSDHDTAHADHSGHEMMFRRKFWISLLLSIPVLLYSKGLQMMLGISLPTFPGSQWIAPVFSIVVFIYGGLPFLKLSVPELKNRQPGMMTLISLAISVALIYSLATLFLPGQSDFFWELVTLIDIMLLGHWIEMRSIRQASGSLNALAKLMPDTADRINKDGSTESVPVGQLHSSDMVLVRPGASIPVDGKVVEGESSVNEAMITGESKPVQKTVNSDVIGGSINGDGSLRIQVTAIGDQTALAGIMRLVTQAQMSKSRTQILADRAAGWLFYVALGAAIITAIAWIIGTGFNLGVIERVATVLVIACPHALGLAVPLVVAISTSISAQKGLLIRNRTAFENARLITTIIFDKTGTLTKGSHELQEIKVLNPQFNDKELLRLASGVEQNSEHYIAAGFLRKVKELNIQIPTSENFNYLPGKGLEGTVEGIEIKVVGPAFLKDENITIPEIKEEFTGTVVYILVNKEVAGYFSFSDQIRESSFEAIKILKEAGIKNLLLTGDNEKVAKKVSDELKMDGFLANVLPHEKLEKVKELQEKGEFVAMTGDGVNDAPALAQADVGIAVGSGTDVAAETADIILVNSDPKDIANLILFGKATFNKMIQNLWWAAGYNILAIPLAAGVLYKWGFMLSPAIGAVLMSLSTIVVAINAQLLKTKLK